MFGLKFIKAVLSVQMCMHQCIKTFFDSIVNTSFGDNRQHLWFLTVGHVDRTKENPKKNDRD